VSRTVSRSTWPQEEAVWVGVEEHAVADHGAGAVGSARSFRGHIP
jgi:hypothetical protein